MQRRARATPRSELFHVKREKAVADHFLQGLGLLWVGDQGSRFEVERRGASEQALAFHPGAVRQRPLEQCPFLCSDVRTLAETDNSDREVRSRYNSVRSRGAMVIPEGVVTEVEVVMAIEVEATRSASGQARTSHVAVPIRFLDAP